jgi:ABC-type dipeptide/oligopeptide/nickel transport system permease subunit
MPGIFGLLVLGPALFIISIAGFISSFGGDTDDITLFRHDDYYVFTFIILLLFAAVVGPAQSRQAQLRARPVRRPSPEIARLRDSSLAGIFHICPGIHDGSASLALSLFRRVRR